jgi:hypothetical protein
MYTEGDRVIEISVLIPPPGEMVLARFLNKFSIEVEDVPVLRFSLKYIV